LHVESYFTTYHAKLNFFAKGIPPHILAEFLPKKKEQRTWNKEAQYLSMHYCAVKAENVN